MNFPIALEAYVYIEETDELPPDRLLAKKVAGRNSIPLDQ